MNSAPARRLVSSLAVVLAVSPALFADVTPATLFQDHAVLQRGKPVPVWGTADAGEQVTVTFADQSKSTVAGQDGRWSVTLDPLSASATSATLTIAGNNTLTFSDILIGEVWLASGQSNMEWAVKDTYDHALDVPASANLPIRHIKIPRKVSDTPLTQAGGSWQTASPATAGEFTAVGYYFARDIHALVGVPVGIINSTWGGTRAESWTDPDTLATNAALSYVGEAWSKTLAEYPALKAKHDADFEAWLQRRAAAHAAGESFSERAPGAPSGPGHHATPSGLYNAMIHPLVPFALRGTIWYQGESNAGGVEQAVRYHELFSAMITGWRAKFGQGDVPFYWVQLANFSNRDPQGDSWAFLRESQTKTLALSATGQAVAIDIGDVRDIHPRNMKDVGRRLARLALAREYGFQIADSGPVFQKAEREGAGYRVTFAHGRLTAPLNTLAGFEIAGADKVFHPADAKIERDAVLVSSAAVPEPVAVRYAWRNAPAAGLFNREGLPAAPFRTDNW
jgi:sialate O-acetylesterase